MGRFSTQYETRSLMVGMLLRIPHSWELLPAPHPSHLKISKYTASDLCLYVNSAHAEKDLSWARCYLPTPAETFRFMTPISSLRSARQSEPFQCDQCRSAEEYHACRSRLMLGFIDIGLHAYQTLLVHVSGLQSSHLIGNRYNTTLMCLSKETKRQKKRGMCVHA